MAAVRCCSLRFALVKITDGPPNLGVLKLVRDRLKACTSFT